MPALYDSESMGEAMVAFMTVGDPINMDQVPDQYKDDVEEFIEYVEQANQLYFHVLSQMDIEENE